MGTARQPSGTSLESNTRSPQHLQVPAGPIHLLSQLPLTFWRRKRKLGVKELPLPQGRKQWPLPCPPASSSSCGLGGQNRPRWLREQHQPGGPHLARVPGAQDKGGTSVTRGSHLTADTFQAAGTLTRVSVMDRTEL